MYAIGLVASNTSCVQSRVARGNTCGVDETAGMQTMRGNLYFREVIYGYHQ